MEGENAFYSASSLSEYLGSEIYRILGYDVHQTILGVRNNKLIVACKDFAVDGFLLEIRLISSQEVHLQVQSSPCIRMMAQIQRLPRQ